MIGSNHSKVALIERRDLADIKPLGESDERAGVAEDHERGEPNPPARIEVVPALVEVEVAVPRLMPALR